MPEANTLERLAALIHSRRSDTSGKSYTTQLLTAGTERCAKKFGEEAVEAVIAAMGTDAAGPEGGSSRRALSSARAARIPQRLSSKKC